MPISARLARLDAMLAAPKPRPAKRSDFCQLDPLPDEDERPKLLSPAALGRSKYVLDMNSPHLDLEYMEAHYIMRGKFEESKAGNSTRQWQSQLTSMLNNARMANEEAVVSTALNDRLRAQREEQRKQNEVNEVESVRSLREQEEAAQEAVRQN